MDTELVARLQAAVRDAAALVEELRRTRDRIVEASASSNADDEHDPEGATIAWEREQVSAQIAAAERTRADAEQALADLHAGRYGICEVCGRPIAPERLEARPGARTCIDCAQAASTRRR